MVPVPLSRGNPERACRDKVGYTSWDEAAQRAKEQEEDFKSPMSAYKCPHCHFWHTGNTPRWMQLDEENNVFREYD